MSRTRPTPRGFLLVLVLLVLVLVSVLLLSLARGSGARAVEARDAAVELQRRWGEATLSAALLPRAEALLDHATDRQRARGGPPVARIVATLELADATFDVAIADEQAKANVGALARVHGDRAEEVVRQLLPTHVPRTSLRLRPDPRAAEPANTEADAPPIAQAPAPAETEWPPFPPTFGAWGQVLRDADPGMILSFDEDEAGVADRLTLWGDGRLALARADRATLAAVAGQTLSAGQVRRVLEAREAQRDTLGSIELWLAAAELTREDREVLMARMTDRSRCYSVAIASHTPWRVRYAISIRETLPADGDAEAAGGRGEKERVIRFTW